MRVLHSLGARRDAGRVGIGSTERKGEERESFKNTDVRIMFLLAKTFLRAKGKGNKHMINTLTSHRIISLTC